MSAQKHDPDLTALEALLTRETRALDKGQTEEAVGLLPEKQALLERLEARSAEFEARLPGDTALGEMLTGLRTKLEGNGRRLARLAEAAAALATDLRRIAERHGLGGLYGKTGAARQDPVTRRPRIDQQV
ncbi:hypothetical protein [Litorisediminicola beolgyonensis]|uniref:FlgN protein n=1 Tax=Litorisediminicola beolgyonensis TaxID=1173614 RepID=A0ABW3ZG90_9RHOB